MIEQGSFNFLLTNNLDRFISGESVFKELKGKWARRADPGAGFDYPWASPKFPAEGATLFKTSQDFYLSVTPGLFFFRVAASTPTYLSKR